MKLDASAAETAKQRIVIRRILHKSPFRQLSITTRTAPAADTIDVQTGKEALVAPVNPPRVYDRYPEWSAQGDRLHYERGEIRGNIWTIAIQ